MHPAVEAVLRHFDIDAYRTERDEYQVKVRFSILAHEITGLIPDGGAELTVALRKLLEAQDAAVRATQQ